VSIQTILAGGIWLTLVDADQLENALINLAANARDAMPGGGKLTLETVNSCFDEPYVEPDGAVMPGDYVGIFVTDTGCGMPPEVVAQAFEPFYTTKEPGQGTGLGLSQVYGFIKQSQGHIRIDSEVGRGTTVRIYLPRHRGVYAEEAEHAGFQQIPRGNGETVLLVEDDPDVRGFSIEVLADLGYRVLAAADGASALRVLDVHPETRLLFTDVVLPGGLDGRQLAEKAVLRYPHLKVLYTTGYAQSAIIHQGRLDPGVDVVFKPFQYAEVAAKLREILNN
jgi:CheY-like chemotaxis protein